MEENPYVDQSTQHINRESKNQKGDSYVNELCAIVRKRFEKIMKDIRTDQKIQSYIIEINIKPQTIIQSFNFIIQSNEKLVRSSSTRIIRDSTTFYFQTVLKFIDSKDTTPLDAKGRTVWYLQIETKFHILAIQLFNFKTEHDITNSPEAEYRNVWEKITIIPPNNLTKIKKQYKKLKDNLHLISSSILNEEEYEFSVIKKIVFGCSCTKYLVMNDSSKLRSFVFYRNPTIEIAQKLWNIPQNGAIKHLTKITFDSIQTNLKMYIPNDGEFNPNIDIFQERPNTITVRMLYNKKIYKYPTQQRSGCCVSPIKNIKYIDKIIIHMHGGGFLALSSRTTQNYTRRWANQLGVPIFSIDYRMPPKHPYPQAPADCLTVYRFLMSHIEHYLNIRPRKVYIAGDSAGGNLACVLTGMILKYHKQATIGGLYAIYPGTDLRKMFSHSRLYSISDPLLWPTVLYLCLTSYLKDQKQANDPFASPILLTEQFVSGEAGDKRFPLKWPKTIVTVGNKDPLYDDSLVLIQKMVQSKIDCQCFIYDGLSHGFLSTEMFVSQCEKTIKDSIQHLRSLIQQQKGEK